MNKSMNAVDDDFDCVKVEVFHKCFLFHEIESNKILVFYYIKISDLDNSCPSPTILSLMKCKKQVLHPFRKLLCLVSDSIHTPMRKS
jgi:hypothetical protein